MSMRKLQRRAHDPVSTVKKEFSGNEHHVRLFGAKLQMAFLKKSPKWSLLLEEEFWCVGCTLHRSLGERCLPQGLQQRYIRTACPSARPT